MHLLSENDDGCPSESAHPLDTSFRSPLAAQCGSPQRDVLGVVAHELRNALQPIGLAAELLRQAGDDEARRLQVRSIIERQIALMSRLVADLLDTCRADNRSLKLELVPVDLVSVIADAMHDCGARFVSRGQQVRLHLPEQPATVRGDPVRLAQIVGNLLTNASKYTARGGTVEVTAESSSTSVQLTIADNGIGITAEVLPHIFEPFVQDPRAVAFDAAGIGIGLSVVRELVRAHGGSVFAHSAGPGLGSRFVVTLPLAGSARILEGGWGAGSLRGALSAPAAAATTART